MKTPPFVLLLALAAPVFLPAASAAGAKENWEQYCAKCHAADGSGKTKIGQKLKAKDYTDAQVQAAFTDEQLEKVTIGGASKDGREVMRGFKDDLSVQEVKDLVAYIRTMKK